MKGKLKNIINNLKKIVKNINKKVFVILGVVLVVIVLIVSLVIAKPFEGKSQEEKLTNRLEELGIDFYENFYYNQISKDDKEREEFLKKYTDIGIKINLDNLSRFKVEETKKIIKEFVNDETKKECDKVNSVVVIYPKEPYKKESYKVDVILDCGYKKSKK